MVRSHHVSFGGDELAFYLPRTLQFSLLSFNECSLFLLLPLACIFCLDFCFRSCLILASRCIWTSGICWFSSKEFPQKGLNGVGKEKSFMQKSGTKRSLCRLRPRLLHVVLDVFLIVCLVNFAVEWLVSNDWDCLMSLLKGQGCRLEGRGVNRRFKTFTSGLTDAE
jgi:hypothetical protein